MPIFTLQSPGAAAIGAFNQNMDSYNQNKDKAQDEADKQAQFQFEKDQADRQQANEDRTFNQNQTNTEFEQKRELSADAIRDEATTYAKSRRAFQEKIDALNEQIAQNNVNSSDPAVAKKIQALQAQTAGLQQQQAALDLHLAQKYGDANAQNIIRAANDTHNQSVASTGETNAMAGYYREGGAAGAAGGGAGLSKADKLRVAYFNKQYSEAVQKDNSIRTMLSKNPMYALHPEQLEAAVQATKGYVDPQQYATARDAVYTNAGLGDPNADNTPQHQALGQPQIDNLISTYRQALLNREHTLPEIQSYVQSNFNPDDAKKIMAGIGSAPGPAPGTHPGPPPKPGTPEYNRSTLGHDISKGAGQVNAANNTQEALDRQATTMGLLRGTPAYNKFMASHGVAPQGAPPSVSQTGTLGNWNLGT